jgi:hypothetical protein
MMICTEEMLDLAESHAELLRRLHDRHLLHPIAHSRWTELGWEFLAAVIAADTAAERIRSGLRKE